MTEYRTPEEDQAQTEHEDRVRAVLDQAVQDAASLIVAMTLDEPAEVVERWTDALWGGLRDNLSDDRPPRNGLRTDDRLAAIVLLLTGRAESEAAKVLRSIREADE